MTTDVYIRVWNYTPDRRGTRKLLLLALARFAHDPLGICWPNQETIAAMISEKEDYTRKLLGDAEQDGDIVRRPGKGRGNPTIYGVAVGLSDEQCHRLATIVAHTIVRKNVRYIEVEGERLLYAPGVEERLFATEKEVLQSPFSGGENVPDGENADPPADLKTSRPARRPAAEPEHIRWLRVDEGIITAGDFIHCDPEALIADYVNRRAENQHKGTIVKLWKQNPPTKENHYRGRQNETNQPGRPINATPSQRRAKPGELDYY